VFMMKIDASVSAFPPVNTTLAPHEGRQMEVDLEQEPGPYLGSPGIKEDLDLFDPRLHDFRPSLIGRCFEEGEESRITGMSNLSIKSGRDFCGTGRRPSAGTLSLDSQPRFPIPARKSPGGPVR
jgi:hypothetical protein